MWWAWYVKPRMCLFSVSQRSVLAALRVVTRRAFKTGSQLAASQAARWKIARSLLGWCERPPKPTPGPSTKQLSAAETSARLAALGEKSALAAAVPVGEVEDRGDDNRPRKRAVVRIPRKRRVRTLAQAMHTVDQRAAWRMSHGGQRYLCRCVGEQGHIGLVTQTTRVAHRTLHGLGGQLFLCPMAFSMTACIGNLLPRSDTVKCGVACLLDPSRLF